MFYVLNNWQISPDLLVVNFLQFWRLLCILLFQPTYLLRITIGFPSSWLVCVLSGFSSSKSPTDIILRRLFIHFIFLWCLIVHFLRFLGIHSFSFIASSSLSLISSASSIVAAGIFEIKTKVRAPDLVCVTKLILKKRKELFNFFNVYLGTKRNNIRKQKKKKQNKFKKGKTRLFFFN